MFNSAKSTMHRGNIYWNKRATREIPGGGRDEMPPFQEVREFGDGKKNRSM